MASGEFNPLLGICESYVLEACPDSSPKLFAELRQTTAHYLTGIITLQRAAGIFFDKIGTTRPIERIYAILLVPDRPIPSPSSTTSPPGKNHSWSEYEDQRLLCGVHKFGLSNWTAVAEFVGNHRTRTQCSQRWLRGLDPRISKASWSHDEEERLLELVERYGPHAWTRIASQIRTRSDSQCRYHYLQMTKEQQKVSDSEIPNLLSVKPSPGLIGPPKAAFPCIADLLHRIGSA
jgi:hypothetical protein